MAKSKKFSKQAQAFSMPVMAQRPKHEDQYEIEDAARHLEKHQEIKANRRLHRAAKLHLKEKHRAISKALKEK